MIINYVAFFIIELCGLRSTIRSERPLTFTLLNFWLLRLILHLEVALEEACQATKVTVIVQRVNLVLLHLN